MPDISIDMPFKSVRRKPISSTGFNGLPAYTPSRPQEASYSFQQALQQVLNPPRRRLHPQTLAETAQLLSINPNLNLKLISSLHPGAALVMENGHTRLEIPIPQLDQPGLQAHSSAVRQATLLDDFDRDPLRLQAVNDDGQKSAFGKVLASTGLAAVLMGEGVQRSRTVTPESLSWLLNGAVPALPVDAAQKVSRAANDYSHWHIGS